MNGYNVYSIFIQHFVNNAISTPYQFPYVFIIKFGNYPTRQWMLF